MASDRDLRSASLEQLLADLQHPDRLTATNAIQELLRRFRPMLSSMFRKCPPTLEFRDFCQEVIVRVLDHLDAIDPAIFPGYIHSIARSIAADAIAAAMRRPQSELDEATLAFSEPDIVERLLVGSLLDKLSARDRQALELYYYDGLSDTDAAPLLSLNSPGAVRKLRSQALARLRDIALRRLRDREKM
ncbi:MAG: sigma-70 family RNA polymerase sigma factor [Acidobacteria bacterium]|nr:sigma-70 family RNA polymerase sigma factor [Acidobacteriota bacterium]